MESDDNLLSYWDMLAAASPAQLRRLARWVVETYDPAPETTRALLFLERGKLDEAAKPTRRPYATDAFFIVWWCAQQLKGSDVITALVFGIRDDLGVSRSTLRRVLSDPPSRPPRPPQ